MESKNGILREIKGLEKKLGKGKQDKTIMKSLLSDFEALKELEGGPLIYADATTPEELQVAYNIDASKFFDVLERKSIAFKDAGNPNSYPWMPEDMKLVVIENTKENRELAKLIVDQIISAIKPIVGAKK